MMLTAPQKLGLKVVGAFFGAWLLKSVIWGGVRLLVIPRQLGADALRCRTTSRGARSQQLASSSA